ncbi:MAG: hypothetical protein ACRD29_11405 [Acidimicrobiales bacterium]
MTNALVIGAVGLTPLTFAMVGLMFALWANGVQLLGAFPEREGGAPTGPTIAVIGSFAGAITLLFDAVWFITGAPFGSEGDAVQAQLVFGAIAGMYGLLWLGAGFAQLRNWDLRPIGQIAVLCFILQAFEILVIAATFRPWTTDLLGICIALGLYLPVLAGFHLVTHGRTNPKWVGWACMAAAAGSFWLAFAPTDIAPFLQLPD